MTSAYTFTTLRRVPPLATISVSAQVTSLIWSTKKREIAATLAMPSPTTAFKLPSSRGQTVASCCHSFYS